MIGGRAAAAAGRHMLATHKLVRDAHRRSDPAWLKDVLARDTTVVHLCGLRSAVVRSKRTQGAFVTKWSTLAERVSDAEPVFLGTVDGVAHFAVALESVDASYLKKLLGADGDVLSLRDAMGTLGEDERNLLAIGTGLMQWDANSRYCGGCGAHNEMREAGHQKQCSNCGNVTFPRTDPAVIMLVTDGAERCVLGRQASWAKGRYSALAGFVELGESLEDGVVRETKEEVGVDVTDVQYFGSQPWPFPQSLMLGFYARAVSATSAVVPDRDELEDARWFSKAELRAGAVTLPPPTSISHSLITTWLKQ